MTGKMGKNVKINLLVISKITSKLATLLLIAVSISTALADQVVLSYVDADSNAQTLIVDSNSSAEDLALAAALLGEVGVGVSHDPDNGSGTLAEIAAAMTTAAPLYAADIALVLSTLSPDDSDAIIAAVNAVTGVNSKAVLAAVHFGPRGFNITGPHSLEIEHFSKRRFIEEEPPQPPVSPN